MVTSIGLSALALVAILASAAQAQTPRPLKDKVAPSQAQPAPPLPNPPLPVKEAQAAGIGQCAPILDLMSRQTLTTHYDVQSGWSRADPSHHIFQSVAALNTPGNNPPDGFAALVAAPVTAGGCDGVALQVFPLSKDCPTAQAAMLRDGKLIASLVNARIMVDARGNRVILVPAYNHTCIAVSVNSSFGTP